MKNSGLLLHAGAFCARNYSVSEKDLPGWPLSFGRSSVVRIRAGCGGNPQAGAYLFRFWIRALRARYPANPMNCKALSSGSIHEEAFGQGLFGLVLDRSSELQTPQPGTTNPFLT